MSVCTFIASDSPLPKMIPQRPYSHMSMEEGPIYDGSADGNFFPFPFPDVQCYTSKRYGVYLGWDHSTDRGLNEILEYIKNALEYDTAIEIWHVWLMDYWLMDYWEYYERPVIHKCTVPFSELTIDDIKEIDRAAIRNMPDKQYPCRLSFYCLIIER